MAASPETQSLKGPGLAAAVAAAVAFFVPGGQGVSAAFFSTFAASYALQGFAMREARKASLRDVSERTTNIRSSQSPHRIVYGEALIGGTIVYPKVTGPDKEYLHLVIPLAGHEIHSVGPAWAEDARLALDGNGVVTTPSTLAGLIRLLPRLGAPGQAANATLVSESGGEWTTAHKGEGIADVYVRLSWNQDQLYTQPTIRMLVRGKKCYDPRAGVSLYTMNPALILRDYLRADYGLQYTSAEIDDTAVSTAANVCDEWVLHDAAFTLTPTPDHTTDTWTTATIESRLATGDRLTLSGVPVPAGLTNGATYYLIRLDGRTYQLATSYQNAIEGVAATFDNNGSGTQTWSAFAQRRYTLNGTFTLDQDPKDIVEDILSAMAGGYVEVGGKGYMFAGAYAAPAITLTGDDLRDAVTIRPRRGRHDLVNQIRGSFVDASRLWIQSDYPPVGDATYATQDGGTTIERPLDFPHATDSLRAQRLAKIALRRARQGQLQMRCKIGALRLAGYSTVAVTIPQLQLAAAVYRIVSLQISGDDGGIGVDLSLQAESADVYAWSASDAVAPVPTVPLDVPAFATAVVAPTGLALASGNAELLTASDGTIISRLRVTWTGAAEPNLTGYEVQYRLSTDTRYISIMTARDQTTAWIEPVADGAIYEVRVRALAAPGQRRSAWLVGAHDVQGKSAAPTAPTSLTVSPAVGGFDIAWTASPDADYGYSELIESSSNNRAAGIVIFRGRGNRFARNGLPGSVTRWYWVVDTDTSGNVSAYYPASATGGVSAATQTPSGGVPTVADASAITGPANTDPPGGPTHWAVYDNATGKIWRWIFSAGAYTKAADGGDLTAASVAADKMAVAQLSAISSNLGTVNAGSIDIGGGKFTVASDGTTVIRSAASGARLETRNSTIKVYDASGQLRVHLGDLSA